MEQKIKETDIVNQILAYLRINKVFCWRQGTGKFFSEYKGKRRAFSSGVPGLPDIIGVLKNGRMLAIEAKIPKRKGNLSEHQKEIIAILEKNNALVFVATGIDDVIEKMEGII